MTQCSIKSKTNNIIPDFTPFPEYYLVWNFLFDLNQYYPNLKDWFFNKVCPDIAIGKRKIILKQSGYRVIAVAILKNLMKRKKFVLSEYQKMNRKMV